MVITNSRISNVGKRRNLEVKEKEKDEVAKRSSKIGNQGARPEDTEKVEKRNLRFGEGMMTIKATAIEVSEGQTTSKASKKQHKN